MNAPLIITPKTKVLQLIETYPQLEEVLIEYVPAFKKLKNPVLRNTIAKVATLQQAASIGNVKLEDLINHLRKAVGQDVITATEDQVYQTEKPDWFDENKIAHELDVREMLARGEHPVHQVMADLNTMPSNTIFKLIAPFLTAPLIDKAGSIGIKHWVKKETDALYFIFFYKP